MYITLQTVVYPCSLGHVLVSSMPSWDNKLCRLELGPDPKVLMDSYCSRFKKEYTRFFNDSHDENFLKRVFLAVEESKIDPQLDLYTGGTTFQKAIWNILKTIPIGEKWSYKQVAKKFGNSDSSRAVANACGANPIAIVIPCHRVIASNGDLGGYHWGVELKQKLLDRENKSVNKDI